MAKMIYLIFKRCKLFYLKGHSAFEITLREAENARIGFTRGLGSCKGVVDAERCLICGGEPLAYHPKMGR